MANYASNINVRHRLTQIVILVLLILSTMLFFEVASASPIHKRKFDRPKYRVAVHKNSHRTCYILFKKRTTVQRHSLLASRRSKNNNKPMAETDAGSPVTASN